MDVHGLRCKVQDLCFLVNKKPGFRKTQNVLVLFASAAFVVGRKQLSKAQAIHVHLTDSGSASLALTDSGSVCRNTNVRSGCQEWCIFGMELEDGISIWTGDPRERLCSNRAEKPCHILTLMGETAANRCMTQQIKPTLSNLSCWIGRLSMIPKMTERSYYIIYHIKPHWEPLTKDTRRYLPDY